MITVQSFAADKLRLLSPEAYQFLPVVEYGARAIHYPGRNGLQHFIGSPRGDIPYKWLVDFLRAGSIVSLAPVGHYPDSTSPLSERYKAQFFTELAVSQGFATAARGPNPALWITANSRDEFAVFMGLEKGEISDF